MKARSPSSGRSPPSRAPCRFRRSSPSSRQKAREALEETYSELTPWQKTQVARHPERPHFRHYIDGLVEDFTPLAGDRYFGEDQAIIGGIGRLKGRSAMIIGHEKGSDTEGRIKHNFGMARPEGYRKASG